MSLKKLYLSISNAVPGYNIAKRTKIILNAMGVSKETVSIPWREFNEKLPRLPMLNTAKTPERSPKIDHT